MKQVLKLFLLGVTQFLNLHSCHISQISTKKFSIGLDAKYTTSRRVVDCQAVRIQNFSGQWGAWTVRI